MAEQDRRLSEALAQQRPRLRGFIQARVLDESDAEDILEEALGELLEAVRFMRPIAQVGAWPSAWKR